MKNFKQHHKASVGTDRQAQNIRVVEPFVFCEVFGFHIKVSVLMLEFSKI